MNCIEIDEIFSTTVLYEGVFDYINVFKFSKGSIYKLKQIADKYETNNDTFNNNKNYIYLREFIYKFNSSISIDKIIYPVSNKDFISYEVIDLSNSCEKVIMSHDEIVTNNSEIEINFKSIKSNYIKLRFKSKINIWPEISDIQIIKSA